MATTSSAIPISGGLADNQLTIKDLGATSKDDMFGGSGKVIRQIQVDCTANSGEDVYVKLYDAASATVGTTAPGIVVKGFKGVVRTYDIFPSGSEFVTGVTAACVQEKGQAGTTAPSGTVDVVILTS